MKEKKSSPWSAHTDWQQAEKVWDEGAKSAQAAHPLKVLSNMPSVPGITEDAAKHLKWKSLKWMVAKDEQWKVTKYILKKPFTHLFRFVKSLLKGKSYVRDGDFFLYGLESVDAFKVALKDPDALFVVGFSYCEKPHECPSGRFTANCIHDPENTVCRQCFIGKCVNSLPERRSIPLFIPTIHYIGEKIFEIQNAHPNKRLLFLITACELTLEMFGDYGNLAGIQGIGVRLDGRICNTMRAFELSEAGIKPGLTVVLKETEKRILDLLAYWREQCLT